MLEMTNISSLREELRNNSIVQLHFSKIEIEKVRNKFFTLSTFNSFYYETKGENICDQDFLDKYGSLEVSLPYEENEDSSITVYVRLKLNALISEYDRLKLLTVSAFEAIAIEIDGKVIDCNDEYLRLFEYESKSDATGKSSIKNLNLDELFIESIVNESSIEFYECDATTQNGKEITIEVQRKPIKLAQGEGKRVSIKDVSARRKITKDLDAQNTIYKAVFQTKNSLMCIFNDAHEIINISSALADLLKIEAKEVTNKKFEDVTDITEVFADGHNLNKLYSKNGSVQMQLLPGEDEFTGVIKCINKYGQNKILDVTLSKLSNNNMFSYLLNVVDITELHGTIENLYAKEKELTQTLLSSKLAGWRYDMETRMIHFSEEAVKSFNLQSVMSFEEFIMSLHSDDQFKTANAFLPALSGSSFKTDTRLLIDNTLYHIHIVGFSSNKNGDKSRFLNGFFQDISEHKAQEYELKAAKRKAESATEAKNVFLANMSHEIRTPLNSILGFSQLLEQKLENPEFLKYISHIKNSGDILMRLISEVLDFSKLEANKIELQINSFSLNDFAQYHKNFFSQLVEEKQIDFKLNHTNRKDIFLLGDLQRINQIIINLVGNAIKFTNKGEVSLNIDYKQVDGHDHLIFKVKDTGIGISKVGLQKIFHPFTQEESNTSKRFGGTGLGLSIVKNLVEKMKGQITVNSEKGLGSEFEVLLPLEKSEIQKPVVSEKPIKIKNIEKLNILVAEDNPTNQLLIKAILDDFGLKYEIANNGQEALDLLESKSGFNLGVFDIQMPVLDGKSAMKQILRFPNKYPQIPVIALTADATEQEKLSALKIGFSHFLTKPLKIHEFYETIGRFSKIDIEPKVKERLKKSKKVGKTSKYVWKTQLDYIEEVTNNDETVIKELLSSALNDFFKRMAILEESKNNLDVNAFKNALHAIKGSLTMFLDQNSCDRVSHYYKSFSPEMIDKLDFEPRAEQIIKNLSEISPLLEDLHHTYE